MIDLEKLRMKAIAGNFASGDVLDLLDMLESAQKDEARIAWMQEHYLCADFRYGEPACEVIVIEMPRGSRVCGDLRTDIDAAMQS
jgi:hypothetical protein